MGRQVFAATDFLESDEKRCLPAEQSDEMSGLGAAFDGGAWLVDVAPAIVTVEEPVAVKITGAPIFT